MSSKTDEPVTTEYEYKVVVVGEKADLQHLLDEHSIDGWRFIQTGQSMGYTVRLIFERAKQ